MEFYGVIILLLAIAIGLYPLASKINIPYPVLSLLAGAAVGFIPGFEHIPIDPEVVFFLFLPPMLYDAAYKISYQEFKHNIGTISLLSISLVFITTIGIAIVSYYLIPKMNWPLAFVLGAILSPPDAIAAAGAVKGLNLPHRTLTILEGESLVNDASTLVAFRFAVAAVAGQSFILWKAGLVFLLAIGGGIFVGWVMWIIFRQINKKLQLHRSVIVSLDLMLPFVTYFIAEQAHVSGVIAVVTVGLFVSGHKGIFSRQVRVQSKSVWETTIFLLGGLIFVLIGLEFPHTIKNIPSRLIFPLIGCSLIIFSVALFIRMGAMLWHKKDSERRFKNIQLKLSNIPEKEMKENKQYERRLNRYKNLKPLDIKDCIIIGWSGMRGIVSLAAALSLPLLIHDGTPFPMRNTIISISVVTVILMLLIQGLGLPLLIKFLKIGINEE